MIRLIIALLGIILFWLWLFAPLSKRPKIILTSLILVLAIGLALFESYSHKPRENLIDVTEISICGLNAQHRYRSDYRVNLCLKNTAETSAVKRVSFSVSASNCDGVPKCEVLETVVRDIPVTIKPNETVNLMETLRFELVLPEAEGVLWSADVISVKAVP